ncbi:hypothetical protein G3I51_23785 [Streptomyces sp. SID9944]|nr:hypothetical protein [Streptomyces sp. SID9944]
MRSATARRTLSRRRAFLIVVGIGWAGYGSLGILHDPRYGTTRSLDSILRYVPLDVLGWMWIALGAFAALAGLAVGWPRLQSAGYAALAVPAMVWAAVFSWSSITDFPQGAGSACGWAGFAAGVFIVSGMDDPLPRPLRKVH